MRRRCVGIRLYYVHARRISQRVSLSDTIQIVLQKRIDRIRNVVENRQENLIVVLEDVHDPHNASAILRTCDALGIQNVWFAFETEQRYNPGKIGKASSSSANKWLDFAVFDSSASCIEALKQQGYSIVVTALTDASVSLMEYRAGNGKIAVVVGNEHRGVSDAMLAASDTVLQIPMFGFVQSLNVSVATAIVLWEITRQRRQQGTECLIPEEKKGKLLADLLERGKGK